MLNELFTIGSMAASLWGSKKESDSVTDTANRQAAEYTATAEANKLISDYDAKITLQAAIEQEYTTNQAVARHRDQVDQFMGAQRARFSKSGVAVGKGSALEVQEYSLDEARSQEMVIRREGQKKAQSLRSLADRYTMLGEKGLRDAASASALTMEVANDESEMSMFSGWTTLGQQAIEANQVYGWFDTE